MTGIRSVRPPGAPYPQLGATQVRSTLARPAEEPAIRRSWRDEDREAQDGTNPARDPARLGLPQLADEVDVLGLVLEEHGVDGIGEATPLAEVEADR